MCKITHFSKKKFIQFASTSVGAREEDEGLGGPLGSPAGWGVVVLPQDGSSLPDTFRSGPPSPPLMPTRGITTFGLAHPPPSPPGDTLRGWGLVGPLRNVSERATPLPAGDPKGPPNPTSSALAPTDQDHPAAPIRSMVLVEDRIDGCYKKSIHFFILIDKLTFMEGTNSL